MLLQKSQESGRDRITPRKMAVTLKRLTSGMRDRSLVTTDVHRV